MLLTWAVVSAACLWMLRDCRRMDAWQAAHDAGLRSLERQGGMVRANRDLVWS